MKHIIHHLADVQSDSIGASTTIWQFCVILKNARIGKNCNICAHVFVENDVVVGDNVTIKSGVQLWDGISIEDNVFIGPNVTFTNDLTPRSKRHPSSYVRTQISRGASLGANSTIIAGITVGEYSLIGAGSLVSKDVPAFHLFYGHPASHRGYVSREGVLISMDLKDKDLNNYTIQNGEPVKS